MIVAQSLSFSFDKPFRWRYVQLVGAATAIALVIFSFFTSRADRKADTNDERGITEESSLLSEHSTFGSELEMLIDRFRGRSRAAERNGPVQDR